MTPVLGSIFFTVTMIGAGTSLFASLSEARDALRPLVGDAFEGASSRRSGRAIAVRRRVSLAAPMPVPQRAAA